MAARNINEYIQKKSVFDIVFEGDPCGGRTSLINRFADDTFTEIYSILHPDIDYKLKTVEVLNQTIKLRLWDLKKTKPFHTRDRYRSQPDAAVIVFDISDPVTFSNVTNYLNDLKRAYSTDRIIILVGTKCDLEDARAVSYDAAKTFAEKQGITYIETSAKEATNVDRLFYGLAEQLLKIYDPTCSNGSNEVLLQEDALLRILDLPNEMLLHIAKYLNLFWSELLKLSHVSKKFYDAFSDDYLWQPLLNNFFPNQGVENNFKNSFLEKIKYLYLKAPFLYGAILDTHAAVREDLVFMLALLKTGVWAKIALKYAHPTLKANYKFMLEAVCQNINALQDAAPELQGDPVLKTICTIQDREKRAKACHKYYNHIKEVTANRSESTPGFWRMGVFRMSHSHSSANMYEGSSSSSMNCNQRSYFAAHRK